VAIEGSKDFEIDKIKNISMRYLTAVIMMAFLGATIHCTAQGFSLTSADWALPTGGSKIGGTVFGYSSVSGFAQSADDEGSQSWTLMDMNGDDLTDLVVVGQRQSGQVTSFSPTSGQFWKVYLNSGTGMATVATNWSLPNGGKKSGGIIFGYNAQSGFASTTDNTGSQTWTVTDINGDKLPDLVVTAELQSGHVTSFSPTSNQFWKVYLNSGTGFAPTATPFGLPNGGKKTGGTILGYDFVGGASSSADDVGSQSWVITDMEGDGLVDLLVTGEKQGSNVTSFSPTSSQYWKLYRNQGTTFATASTNWTLPNGGKKSGGIIYGYDFSGSLATTADNAGSQSWNMLDLNNDHQPDLVVTGELQSGHVTSYSPTSGQFWKAYFNNGSGFDLTSTNWTLPNGGHKVGGTVEGYAFVQGFSVDSDDAGSQSWAVMDLNGDLKLDLVVTAEQQSGHVTSFSPTSNQFWKAYLQSGNGFSATSSNWPAPAGGKKVNGTVFGYDNTFGVAAASQDAGSQGWTVRDMDGDFRPDLLVYAQVQSGDVTTFDPTGAQHWKLYRNTSTAVGAAEPNGVGAQISLSPNPSTGSLHVAADRPLHQAALRIVDVHGREVYARQFGNFVSSEIDLSTVANGIYLVSMASKEGVMVERLVVAK
jgi:hypothetical protein